MTKIISEWKKNPKRQPIKEGYKRVMAIVDGKTKHIEIKKS